MPQHVVDRTRCILNGQGRKLWKSRIACWAWPTSPNVSDIRESPALEVVKLLRENGAECAESDPHVYEPEAAEAATDAAMAASTWSSS